MPTDNHYVTRGTVQLHIEQNRGARLATFSARINPTEDHCVTHDNKKWTVLHLRQANPRTKVLLDAKLASSEAEFKLAAALGHLLAGPATNASVVELTVAKDAKTITSVTFPAPK